MRVRFQYKNGTVRPMNKNHAGVLEKLKKGRILPDENKPADITPPADDSGSTDLQSLTDEQLHAFAKAKNIKVHHKIKGEKLIAAITAGLKAE